MIINNGIKKFYASQRDNKFKPLSTCNVTAYAMFSQINGFFTKDDIEKYYPKYKRMQFEDAFYDFIETNEEVNNYVIKNKFHKIGFDKNEIHAVLAYAYNKFIEIKNTNKTIVKFTTNCSVNKMIKILNSGKVLIISGNYPYMSVRQNKYIILPHISCLVGYETKSNKQSANTLNDIKNFIVYDPYGDFNNYYAPVKGVSRIKEGIDVKMNIKYFIKRVKNLNSDTSKWAHYPVI